MNTPLLVIAAHISMLTILGALSVVVLACVTTLATAFRPVVIAVSVLSAGIAAYGYGFGAFHFLAFVFITGAAASLLTSAAIRAD